MAGYSKMYVVGGQGGFMGADGVNPIEFVVLVGDADRQWLEPHYFDTSIKPLGRLRVIVPSEPDHKDALLDACIAFCPRHFILCPSLIQAESAIRHANRLDFHAIPASWATLREEARPIFDSMSIWQADLVPFRFEAIMERPKNMDLPFFAYGLFKPGQLAYFQLRELVSHVSEPAQVAGSLLLRDGLPIIDPTGHGCVNGALIRFHPERAGEAYDRISAMEPDKHYRWDEASVDGISSNVLFGRSPRKGSVPCETAEWNGWDDPLFKAGLDVVEETLVSDDFEWDLKPLFRLQMAYLLLWSAIERYVSLRYHLGDKVSEKVRQLAQEQAFADGLLNHNVEKREVYRADQPSERLVLDPQSPTKALNYYYQIRSNITHRGKGNVRDHERVNKSLKELLAIFRDILKAAEHDANL
jgi:hypothetical protein